MEKTLRIADCGLGSMNSSEMKNRAKAYALAIIRLVQSLPNTHGQASRQSIAEMWYIRWGEL